MVGKSWAGYRAGTIHARGHTLLELLVVLAILGLLGGWLAQARPSRVGAAAMALRTQVLQARFEAIERNSPVAVVLREDEDSFITAAIGELSLAAGCEEGDELTRLELARFPRVEVVGISSKGLVWLPNGTGRTCSGGGAFNQTITLSDGRKEARVIVSRAGRVRSELAR